MKKFAATTAATVATVIGLVTLGTLAAPTDADARPFHRGGGGRVGVYFGAGVLAAPWAYRPYYYGSYPYYGSYYGSYPYAYPYYSPSYYPPVVVQEQPTVYVEQQGPGAPAPSTVPPTASAPQAQQQFWFFCQDSQTYYPHVQNCASPWQRVTPHAAQ